MHESVFRPQISRLSRLPIDFLLTSYVLFLVLNDIHGHNQALKRGACVGESRTFSRRRVWRLNAVPPAPSPTQHPRRRTAVSGVFQSLSGCIGMRTSSAQDMRDKLILEVRRRRGSRDSLKSLITILIRDVSISQMETCSSCSSEGQDTFDKRT